MITAIRGPIQNINLIRLRHSIDVVRKEVKTGNVIFDMRTWAQHDSPWRGRSCGFAACFGGIYATYGDPQIKDLKIDCGLRGLTVVSRSGDGLDAAEEEFGLQEIKVFLDGSLIGMSAANHLFSMAHYLPQHYRDAEYVCNRIEQFCDVTVDLLREPTVV